jgi:hypothetical protein
MGGWKGNQTSQALFTTVVLERTRASGSTAKLGLKRIVLSPLSTRAKDAGALIFPALGVYMSNRAGRGPLSCMRSAAG